MIVRRTGFPQTATFQTDADQNNRHSKQTTKTMTHVTKLVKPHTHTLCIRPIYTLILLSGVSTSAILKPRRHKTKRKTMLLVGRIIGRHWGRNVVFQLRMARLLCLSEMSHVLLTRRPKAPKIQLMASRPTNGCLTGRARAL